MLFEPAGDPSTIPTKQVRRLVRPLRRGELDRMIVDALIRAEKPLETHVTTTALLLESGHGEAAWPRPTPR